MFPLQPGKLRQAEIKWKRSGNLEETRFRFISSPKRFFKSLGGIASGIGRDQLQIFHTGICGYQDQRTVRRTKLGAQKTLPGRIEDAQLSSLSI
jgi:hypothetical protein